MALPPDGCSPRPDGILGQVQEESKSPFFFTSGHVLRYIEYPGVHTTHGYYRLYVPTLCVQIRVNNWKLVPLPGRSVVTSLVPSRSPGSCPLCKTDRPLPGPPCSIGGQFLVETVICFWFLFVCLVLIKSKVMKNQQGF